MTEGKKQEFVSDDEVKDENLTNNQSETETEEANSDNMSETGEVDLQTKYDELNNSYLRLHAEFDNYRKRTLKEKAELIKSGGERVLSDILPVLDDFERAIETIGKAENLDAVKEGVGLIHNKFVAFLNKHGVKEIETVGQPFDVDKHEALTTIPAQDDSQKDTIVDCVQKGYVLGDKVIRYPKVIVAK
ncbi:nucleotide exchange factor GrpE [Dysgonomonas sp. 520]|uniref:nucleotide exchange factor GrpE n=1 Tax=Dysgonomonas sp. 520 TaxID=2302931 RepID=UPI0013D34F71|nr:nucleotide exchange factor GrpE [Dysgonomonas sp. 520]NDW10344.1 nucleotide exchange factor GrpE [Dysgonomonas sp. 520]